MDTEADKDWPQLVDHAFGHFVEPSLVEPTIVYGHPVELSPFARVTDEDEAITERFEYFAAGMELGNAYTEINDADEQQRRFDEQSEHVEGVRGDPDYVEALSYGMPPTGGSASGSTASSCSCPGARRSATSFSSRRCAHERLMAGQYHVALDEGDVAPTVSFPATLAASRSSTAVGRGAPRATNREYVTWTGTYRGTPISCTSTGIGAPWTAIAIEEPARVGATTFIRIGTCGTFLDDVSVGDMALFDSAVRLDGAPLVRPIEFPRLRATTSFRPAFAPGTSSATATTWERRAPRTRSMHVIRAPARRSATTGKPTGGSTSRT